MTEVIGATEEEIAINNEIYDAIIDGGSEILNNPILYGVFTDPIKYLDNYIEFFRNLDSVDGYNKCANLLRLKKEVLNKGK